MSRNHLLAVILTLSSIVAPAATRARAVDMALDRQDSASQTQDHTDEIALQRLLTQFQDAQLSMSDAMTIVEKRHAGSRTVDITFEASSSPAYRVRTVKNDEIWENLVDAKTGSFSVAEISSSLEELDGDDLRNVLALKSVRQELSDAVRVAERNASGRALAGGLIKGRGDLNFVVVVESGGRLKEVTLEPPKIRQQGSRRGSAR